MLVPRKTKYSRQFKGRMKGNAKKGTNVEFGMFGMKALQTSRVTSAQIEAVRRVLIRSIRKVGRLWIRIFPDVPITKKPSEVRQGRGKGSVDHWVCKVKPGRILFEIDGLDIEKAKQIFTTASEKLPLKTKMISKIQPEAYKEFVNK